MNKNTIIIVSIVAVALIIVVVLLTKRREPTTTTVVQQPTDSSTPLSNTIDSTSALLGNLAALGSLFTASGDSTSDQDLANAIDGASTYDSTSFMG
jgi:hypothetical protein